MAVLAIKEFERIECGVAFDPEARVVNAVQRRRLEQVNEDHRRRLGAKILEYGPRNSLVAQNFVGVIDIGGHQVEILPKIEGARESEVRHNLATMISVAMDLEIHAGPTSAMRQPAPNVLEILVRLFCSQLWAAVHRGIVKRYVNRSDDLPVVKGRLDVVRQTRRHAARHDLLACRFDEFSENNALNQVLKAALVVLQGSTKAPENARSVADLLFVFHDVADVPITELRWHEATVDRLSRRFHPLLSLARLFIEGKAPDVVTGSGHGFALLFDMNELFEKYVGRMVRQVAAESSITVSLQGPSVFLAHRDGAGLSFKLMPDIVGHDGSGIAWIADTKWKRLDTTLNREGLASTDMYQMHAYARRYDAKEVVLIYPHHSGLGPWRACRDRYHLMADDAERRVSVATVDLRDLAIVPAQLAEILGVLRRPM